MEKAYLDYAMSVIVARALPDVRDGLKPVQRRIIYAMRQQGLTPGARFAKCAAVVGETMKKFHPHGDLALYDALVRMAQNFSLRYPLIDGQGNFGSIDGDSAAAMRYTECRLTPIATELLQDIEKETVNFSLNYSGDLKEPEVFPAVIPNLLFNGATGIAVGMATNIPPHNLKEVLDALIFMIGHPAERGNSHAERDHPAKRGDNHGGRGHPEISTFESAATVEDLVKIIRGPDFPTGGTIYNQEDITQVYATGRGRIVTRAKTEIEETARGRFQIIVSEIPYQVNKASLVAKIAQLVKNKKIEGISDLRDESDRRGLRVVIELKRDARPQKVLNRLFKHTELQKAFNANIVALVFGEPKTLTLKMILEEFIRHRQRIIVRRSEYLLRQAKAREHILQGLKIALDHLDEVIETIKKSPDADIAKQRLVKRFGLTEIQATAILDMQLRRLAALERQKIEDELKEILKTIQGLEALLASREKILTLVKEEFQKIGEKYGDPRRTKVNRGQVGEFREEELITEEDVIISITEGGYIKRLSLGAYRTQGRGGKGVSGTNLKETDQVAETLTASTHSDIFFFTNRGKVYKLKAWDLPEASRTAKGTAIINLIDIAQGERITSILTNPKGAASPFIVMATNQGTVKRTALAAFENIRRTGILAINLKSGDELSWVKATSGEEDIILTTAQGKSIRFSEKDARPMGRNAGGVRGIKLGKDDAVVGMDVIQALNSKNKSQEYLLVISEKGLGKKTRVEKYRHQNRGGSGIITLKVSARTGRLVAARV
ncbi:DNA gyrase subunit A, partial [Candidatus Parcubacteria bacterium]|nr:DNA gyrase subunit A [Candidatus Parcubacteria bacterium]